MSEFVSRVKNRRTATAIQRAGSLGLFILLLGCRPESANVDPKPLGPNEVARIGSVVISVDGLLAERARVASGQVDPEVVLERLVRRELLFAEAQRLGFDQSPELQAAWRNLVIQRFQEQLESEADSLPVPTAGEIEAEYLKHPERYATSPQVRAALIQLPADGASGLAEEIHAEALRTSAATPGFGLLAQRSLHAASRRQGGDLGWLTRAQAGRALPSEVVSALFALDHPGQLSPLVRTAEGVYVLKLVETRPARAKPLAEVREQIVFDLKRSRRSAAEEEAYARLRATHPVQTHPERLASLVPATPPLATHPPQLPSR